MQEKSVDFLRIDINKGQVRKAICICQSDPVMRTLSVSVVDSGTVVDLSECIYAEILIKKADGYEADNGCVINGNSVEYTFRSTDIAAIGSNLAQIMLTFKDGDIITTPSFEIEVYDKVINPKVQKSMNEYTAITEQVVIATNKAAAASADADRAEAAADGIEAYVTAAQESAEAAATSEENAKVSEDNAASSATSASESATSAATDAATINTKMDTALEYAESLLNMEANVEEYAERAESAAESAEASAEAAEASATEAATSEGNASDYSDSASEASSSSATSATTAQSYAMGGTGTREGEDTANAKHFYEKTNEIYLKLGTALVPKGSVLFADLPAFADIEVGYMYNLLDDFTTDDRFREGSGNNYSAGSNVYYVIEEEGHYWDVMGGGSSVLVDTELDESSENPIANSAVAAALDGLTAITETTYEDYLENKDEYDESDTVYLVPDMDYINFNKISITRDEYEENPDYYDALPCLIEITDDTDITLADFSYDNTESGLTASNGQSAIDELNNKLTELEGNMGIKKIIRNTFTIDTKVNTFVIDLGETIDPAKSHVTIYGTGFGNGNSNQNTGIYVASLTSTQLTVGAVYNGVSATANACTFSYEIVEYN